MWLSRLIVVTAILGLAAQGTASPLGQVGSPAAPSAGAAEAVTLAKPDAATQARLSEAYGKLPLSFEANQGQADKQVEFLSRGSGYTLFLMPTKAVLVLRTPRAQLPLDGACRPQDAQALKTRRSEPSAARSTLQAEPSRH